MTTFYMYIILTGKNSHAKLLKTVLYVGEISSISYKSSDDQENPGEEKSVKIGDRGT